MILTVLKPSLRTYPISDSYLIKHHNLCKAEWNCIIPDKVKTSSLKNNALSLIKLFSQVRTKQLNQPGLSSVAGIRSDPKLIFLSEADWITLPRSDPAPSLGLLPEDPKRATSLENHLATMKSLQFIYFSSTMFAQLTIIFYVYFKNTLFAFQ